MNGAWNIVDNKAIFCWINEWKKLKNTTNPIKDVIVIYITGSIGGYIQNSNLGCQ